MNMKRYYGSSGDVTVETLIAKTVPLSTVSRSPSKHMEEAPIITALSPIPPLPEMPTTQQRTQRLSRLISQQRHTSLKYSAAFTVSNF
ncbi:hypothetical protein O3M35_008156 [Rhynocoris fuscipes]|uniref:Uncharacterized protein n=1 Tax=Rhynocoris fuscipes TaxID=488301 RepID=A0AAW1DCT7_9HEMI